MQGFGLVGLLVVVAIVFYLMFGGSGGGAAGTAATVQKTVTPQVHQLGGKDAEGKMATESIAFEAGNRGIVVQSVTPGGAFATKYGLLAGDVITDIGPLVAKDQAADNDTAKAYLHDAYARGDTLGIIRGGQRMKLPVENTAVNAPPAERTTPRGQLDSILKSRPDSGVPTH